MVLAAPPVVQCSCLWAASGVLQPAQTPLQARSHTCAVMGSGQGPLWLRHACSFRGIQTYGLAPLYKMYLDFYFSAAKGTLSSDEGGGPGVV